MRRRHACAGLLLAAALATMPCTPALAAERAVVKEVVVPAPLADVWQAWTTTRGITSFMAPAAEIDPRPGGAFHIHFAPSAPPGQRGADDMRFLALQPMKMLSFDWNAPPSLPHVRAQRTFVTVRFEPLAAASTRVRLHHSGWGDGGEWDQAYAYFDRAWGNVLGKLVHRFEHGPVDWNALGLPKPQ